MSKLPLFLYSVLIVVAVGHSGFFYPQLPPEVASHFSGSGVADNWAAKRSFFIGAALILLLNLAIFFLMPLLFQRFRIEKVNLPNRDYWMAPERVDRFYRYFRDKMCWFGIVNLVFGISVMHLVFMANLGTTKVLDNRLFVTFLGAYFAFVIIWLVSFYRKFSRIP